jgi:WD40 repeat protein
VAAEQARATAVAAEAIANRERETAEQQQAFAEQQADLATSRELALVAQNTLALDPELSILLSLHALQTAYTKGAEDSLHQALQKSRLRMALPDVWAAFAPDGAHLATIDDGTELQVLDLATEQVALTVTLPSKAGQITYSPDGQTIATTHPDDGRVILWDAATGAEKAALGGHTGWLQIAFSPDGRRLASHGGEGVAFLRDLESGETLFTFPGIVHWSAHVAFSSDGALLAVPQQADEQAGTSARLNLWDTRSGALRFSVTGPDAAFTGAATGFGVVAISPDGAYLATVGDGSGVMVLDLPASLAAGQPQPLVTLAGHTSAPSGVAFSPDSSLIVTASQDGTAKVWDPTTGEEYFTLAGHTGTVNFPAFSPDGRRVLTTANDGTRIWDVSLPGNEEVMALAGPDATGSLAMALSPDGAFLALGGVSGVTHLRDAASGELLAGLGGHSKGVFQLAFSPDGKRLASAGNDAWSSCGTCPARLDSGQGQELLTLTGP